MADDHPVLEAIRERRDWLGVEQGELIARLEEVTSELTALDEAANAITRGLIRDVERVRNEEAAEKAGLTPAKPPKPPPAKQAPRKQGADAKAIREAVEAEGSWCSVDDVLRRLPSLGRSKVQYHLARFVKAGTFEAEGKTSSRRFRLAGASEPPKAPDVPPDPPREPAERSSGIEKPTEPAAASSGQIVLADVDKAILAAVSDRPLTAEGIAIKVKRPLRDLGPRLNALVNARFMQRGSQGTTPVYGLGSRSAA